MSAINLIVSTRVETMARQLIRSLESPLDDPFLREVIVVQNKGMEHWLSQRIADGLGICSNIRFFHPNSFIDAAFQSIMGTHFETRDSHHGHPVHFKPREFSQEILAWKIFGLLPLLLDEPAFGEVRQYLGEEDCRAGEVKRYALARRIAHLFDQYLTYRPEMMAQWAAGKAVDLEHGDHQEWQRLLWWKLLESGNCSECRTLLDPALRIEKFKGFSGPIEGIPPRLSFFCVSALPPHHLAIINALSAHMSISMYLFTPCREHWSDCSGREEDEGGNPLLASMGRSGKEFLGLLDAGPAQESEGGEDAEASPATMLAAVQASVLGNRRSLDIPADGLTARLSDGSLQIHSCHSPLREIEVLLDYILSLFDRKGEDLTPRDILVMAPSIDEYAPFIEAVFRDSGIPFSVAQPSIMSGSPLITTFMELLDLYFQRFEVSRVLPLLEKPVIGRRFAIEDGHFEAIEKWVSDTRIRWGFDEFHRKDLDLPAYAENTWASGIDRMLLGYAVPCADPQFVSRYGMLPYGEIEGLISVALGNFIDFTEKLAQLLSELRTSRTLGDWAVFLRKAAGDFLWQPESQDYEYQTLMGVLDNLGIGDESISALSRFEGLVTFDALYRFLKYRLSSETFPFGFFRGGLTFAEFQPLKNIPSPVVCMIGLNFGIFPRRDSELCYDLIALHRMPGDRNIRDNDRALFLEGLLAAGKKLFVSYTGQSITDNAPCPPSIVVSELMDFIVREAPEAERPDLLERMVFRHRLQAFSPDYFREGTGLYSHSEENCRAAEELMKYFNGSPSSEAPGGTGALADIGEPGDEYNTVDVNDLIGFFSNPSRFFARKRLGITVNGGDDMPLDDELFEIAGLERYQVAMEMVAHMLEKGDPDTFYRQMKARNVLPPGNMGQCELEILDSLAKPFVEKIEVLRGEGSQGDGESIPLNIPSGSSGIRVTGSLGKIFPEGIIDYSFSSRQAKYYAAAWIKHLLLNLLAPVGCKTETYCISRKNGGGKAVEVRRFLPVETAGAARQHLEELLELYRAGLRKPLLFFPETSLAFVSAFMAKDTTGAEKGEGAGIAKACPVWDSEYRPRCGEKSDPYYSLFFRDLDPFEGEARAEFAAAALKVFRPLLEGSRVYQDCETDQ